MLLHVISKQYLNLPVAKLFMKNIKIYQHNNTELIIYFYINVAKGEVLPFL